MKLFLHGCSQSLRRLQVENTAVGVLPSRVACTSAVILANAVQIAVHIVFAHEVILSTDKGGYASQKEEVADNRGDGRLNFVCTEIRETATREG